MSLWLPSYLESCSLFQLHFNRGKFPPTISQCDYRADNLQYSNILARCDPVRGCSSIISYYFCTPPWNSFWMQINVFKNKFVFYSIFSDRKFFLAATSYGNIATLYTDQLDGPVLFIWSLGQFAYSKIFLLVCTLSQLLSPTKALFIYKSYEKC